jgi:hypothetical protein
MRTHLILGALMLTAGVILLITGTQASHSMAEVSNTFYGRFTQGTTWYILGGVGTGLVGLYLLLTSLLSRRT